MPIVFAQPSPVGAATSGGRVDARLQQQALQQRERLALADLYQQSAIANAQIAERGAARTQEADMLRAQMGMQEFGIQQQGVRQQNAIEGDRVLQESRIQGQLMLQEQELSQAERLRLQRMKAARAEVAAADWLTPEQKRAYDFEIATGISDLERREAATNVKLKEQALNEGIEQARIRAAMEAEAQAFKAKTLPDRFVTKDIPGIGPMTFYEKSPGQYEPVQGPKQEKPIDPGVQLHDLRKRAEDTILKTMPKGQDGDIDVAEFNRRVQSQLELYENEQKAARARSLGGEGGGQSQSAGGGAAEQKPFDINDVSKATPEQRLVINTIGDTKRLVVESNLPPEAKEMYQEQAAVAEMLLAQHGSVQGMDETKAKLFARIVQSLGQVQRQLTGPRPAPNPPASPPLPPKIANPPVHFTS